MKVAPYLSFEGQCAEAFAFYARVLGGTVEMSMTYAESPMAAQMPAEDRGKIMHVRMSVGPMLLMGSDTPAQMRVQPQGFQVSILVEDPGEAQRVFTALAEGGTVQMPMEKTFWSPAFGMLVDRFGTPWMVNCEQAPA